MNEDSVAKTKNEGKGSAILSEDTYSNQTWQSLRIEYRKDSLVTHENEVRRPHGLRRRRRRIGNAVDPCRLLLSAYSYPSLRHRHSVSHCPVSFCQRSWASHRVQAAPSKEGRIEEPVQPFHRVEPRRGDVSLYIYNGLHTFHPSSRCALHIATSTVSPAT